MLRGGQVICGRNATRIQLNIAMKRAAGFDTVYPTGERRNGQAEKIICLKNRHDLGIVNGMFLELSDVRDENEIGFSATHPDRGRRPGRCRQFRSGPVCNLQGPLRRPRAAATPSASGATTGSRRA